LLCYRGFFGQHHDQLFGVCFIDPSKVSLKAVFLHSGNKFPPVSVAHAASIKEPYESIKILLERIQDEKHNWNICGDLNVNACVSPSLHKVLLLCV
jgi:hypothetical protein